MDAGAAQAGQPGGRRAVQGADAVRLVNAVAGTGYQTHDHHPFLLISGLAWPEPGGFIPSA